VTDPSVLDDLSSPEPWFTCNCPASFSTLAAWASSAGIITAASVSNGASSLLATGDDRGNVRLFRSVLPDGLDQRLF
jgi:hypothetical protein